MQYPPLKIFERKAKPDDSDVDTNGLASTSQWRNRFSRLVPTAPKTLPSLLFSLFPHPLTRLTYCKRFVGSERANGLPPLNPGHRGAVDRIMDSDAHFSFLLVHVLYAPGVVLFLYYLSFSFFLAFFLFLFLSFSLSFSFSCGPPCLRSILVNIFLRRSGSIYCV